MHTLLGVDRDAPLERIRASYLELAKRLHPDHAHSGLDPQEFVRVQAAWECLRDGAQRRAYDSRLAKEKPRQRSRRFEADSPQERAPAVPR